MEMVSKMTRSFIKVVYAKFKSAFWEKVFGKQQKYSRKVKTPKKYYRKKARQQISARKRK